MRQVLYGDSKDSMVTTAGIVVRSGRKWRAQEGLEAAESQLRHKALKGTVVTGHAGLGAFLWPHYERAHGKDRQELFLKEVRAGIEEQRTSRMVGKQQQGAWVRCVGQESVLDGDLVGRTPPHQVHGLITIWPHGPMTIAVVSLWHTWCKQEVYMMTVINSDLCSLCENVIKYAPDKGWQKYVSYSLKKL